jgi:membrane protease YdiL (CAAX protease family)
MANFLIYSANIFCRKSNYLTASCLTKFYNSLYKLRPTLEKIRASSGDQMTKRTQTRATSISDKHRKMEIGAVMLTAAGKFIFIDWLQWQLPFIIAAILGWTTYVILRHSQIPGVMQYWGFRRDNFGKVLQIVLPFGAISIASFFLLGYYLDTINLTWHIIPIMILYPIWGTIQQFLLMALVAGNLQDLKRERLPDAVIIFAAALLFGIVHYPYYWLILGTFVLALFYGYVYLKTRNVIIMGIFHGWLGGLFYYTVVGRDPFAEVFGRFLDL